MEGGGILEGELPAQMYCMSPECVPADRGAWQPGDAPSPWPPSGDPQYRPLQAGLLIR